MVNGNTEELNLTTTNVGLGADRNYVDSRVRVDTSAPKVVDVYTTKNTSQYPNQVKPSLPRPVRSAAANAAPDGRPTRARRTDSLSSVVDFPSLRTLPPHSAPTPVTPHAIVRLAFPRLLPPSPPLSRCTRSARRST